MGHRHGLDPVLLWLWGRPAAVAPTGPLAWDPPDAMGAALKNEKKRKEKKRKKKKNLIGLPVIKSRILKIKA